MLTGAASNKPDVPASVPAEEEPPPAAYMCAEYHIPASHRTQVMRYMRRLSLTVPSCSATVEVLFLREPMAASAVALAAMFRIICSSSSCN